MIWAAIPRFGDANRFHPFHTFCCGDPQLPETMKKLLDSNSLCHHFLIFRNQLQYKKMKLRMTLEDVHPSYLWNKKHLDPCHELLPVGNPNELPPRKNGAPWSSYDAFLVAAFVQRGSKQGIFLEAKLAGVFGAGFGAAFLECVSGLLGKSSRAWTNQKWMDMMIWDDVKNKCAFSRRSLLSVSPLSKFCKHVRDQESLRKLWTLETRTSKDWYGRFFESQDGTYHPQMGEQIEMKMGTNPCIYCWWTRSLLVNW